jgi:3-deoxy-manno-octulosonate cytidylyltransferase (CMP-KDO synthetase)
MVEMSKGTEAIILIPARLAAERLPTKPLADIAGEAMILHIVRRAVEAGIAPVYVAAGDSEIVEAVEAAGFQALLTDPALPSGSDRCVAALKALGKNYDIVINLQGDMPNIEAASIAAVYDGIMASDADCATLVHRCTPEQKQDPNQVKAVLALEGQADYPRCLYFSRSCIPSGTGEVWGHVGLYAWRAASLLEFASLPPTPLEQREKLEQLRALENNMIITAAKTSSPPISVDRAEDLERARKEMSP